ncbi:MaoC family dehydratase [Halopiger djelfimassiliensis]|uniref:MaoC family dehydratase n=1 Tax=Halopiger djelfimassiliensis TaxID=1293047 RepID=UPI00067812C8|nr:MaoC family dehydratase [Halopiger djelfimassiliensis]
MSSNSPDTDVTGSTRGEHWSNISKHVVNSYVEANNAILAAMGITPSDENGGETDHIGTDNRPVSELSFGDDEWLMERSTDEYADLDVGDYVRFTKPITEADVSAFATVSGDTNRLHLEPEFAERTQFGGRIVHGTLVAGTISAALARFPGLTIYLSQDLEFHAPVEIGETVTAECEIIEELGDSRYRVRTTVSQASDEETTVIDGEAITIIRELPTE